LKNFANSITMVKRIKNDSLAYRIIRRVLLFSVMIWVAIFSIYYLFTRINIEKSTKENAELLLENVVNKVEKTLRPIEIIPANLSWMIQSGNLEKDSLYSFLKSIVKNNPSVYASAIAFEPYFYDKNLKYYSPYAYRQGKDVKTLQLGSDNYNYFIMDWYQIPKFLNKPYWSEPYYDTGGANALISTYSVPFYLNVKGESIFGGIITVDISLDWFTDIVNSVKIFETGFAFLITRSGTFVTNPDKSLIMNETIFTLSKETNQPVIRDIGRKMINGEKGITTFNENSKGKISVYYIQFPTNKWSLGLIIPHDEMFADLKKLNIYIIILGLFGLMILLVFTIRIIKKQIEPLSKFSKSAFIIAEGNFNAELPEIKTNDEMKQLRDSFVFMQKELSDYVSNLKATTSAKEKIESELRIAKEIQLGMIPHIFPPFPNLPEIDLYATLISAREVGGDLYDFFLIDDNLLCFAIGDVSGKGVPSSLFMAVTRTLLRSTAEKGKSTADIVKSLNKTLSLNNDSNMFVTLFVGIIDTKTGTLTFCNAGHNPPVLIRENGETGFFPITKSIPVGLFEDYEYIEETSKIFDKDQLFLYTDGVTEAEDIDNNLYGNDKLLDIISKNKKSSPKELIEVVKNDISVHVNGHTQSDDLTMLSIIYYGGRSKL